MDKESIKLRINRFHTLLARLEWLPPLLARVMIGWVFFWAGYGKLGNLEPVIGYFNSIGIPFANIQAPMVAGLELLGGLALVLGFATRYFSAVLIGIMAVALMTAHSAEVNKPADLFKIYEFVYIIVMGYLAIYGAGKFSVDHQMKSKC